MFFSVVRNRSRGSLSVAVMEEAGGMSAALILSADNAPVDDSSARVVCAARPMPAITRSELAPVIVVWAACNSGVGCL